VSGTRCAKAERSARLGRWTPLRSGDPAPWSASHLRRRVFGV